MTVRSINKNSGDVARCCEIYNYYIENSVYTLEFDCLSAEAFGERVERISRDYPYIVAEDDDGNVVGYAYLHEISERRGYMYTCDLSIYVDKDFRGKGIGGALMNEVLHRGAEQGIRDAIAVITGENKPSLAFHGRMGFETVGILKNVAEKHGRRFDVVYMQKNIENLRTSDYDVRLETV